MKIITTEDDFKREMGGRFGKTVNSRGKTTTQGRSSAGKQIRKCGAALRYPDTADRRTAAGGPSSGAADQRRSLRKKAVARRVKRLAT